MTQYGSRPHLADVSALPSDVPLNECQVRLSLCAKSSPTAFSHQGTREEEGWFGVFGFWGCVDPHTPDCSALCLNTPWLGGPCQGRPLAHASHCTPLTLPVVDTCDTGDFNGAGASARRGRFQARDESNATEISRLGKMSEKLAVSRRAGGLWQPRQKRRVHNSRRVALPASRCFEWSAYHRR